MATLVSFLALAGVWFVFAGAMYQSTLELRAEVRARDIFLAGRKLPRPPPVSRWWWLAPPVAIALIHVRRGRAQRAWVDTLGPEEIAALVGYVNKAAGWQLVGTGAFFVAIQQTHTFAVDRGGGTRTFLFLGVVATLVASLTVRVLLGRTDRFLRGR